MFTVAMSFYGFVGLCIAGVILKVLGLAPPDEKKPGEVQAPTERANPPVKPEAKPDMVVKALFGVGISIACVIGVPWALASWGGSRSGNEMYPKNQPVQNFVPQQTSTGTKVIWVQGYYRSDGTYVTGHYRTVADDDTTNNLNPTYAPKNKKK